jgi:hypothetical protein
MPRHNLLVHDGGALTPLARLANAGIPARNTAGSTYTLNFQLSLMSQSTTGWWPTSDTSPGERAGIGRGVLGRGATPAPEVTLLCTYRRLGDAETRYPPLA